MKAAVWTDYNKIEVKEIPTPVIGEEEALIKVLAAGVCVTDYHVISGKLKIGAPPNVQGHEICGKVVEINSKRQDIKVGERCVIATSLGCGHCSACREGKQYLCNESSEIGYTPHNGGYAEYVKVPVSAIVPIPDTVSNAAGAILESAVCPTESLMNVGVKLNSTAFVLGAGPAALAFISLLKVMGAGKIIALVRREETKERVLKAGATDVINSKEYPDVEKRLLEITNGNKADIVIESTGAPNVISEALNYVAKGGKYILYGIPGDNDVVNFNIKKIITEEIKIYGAVGNTKAWYPLVELISNNKFNIESFVTHRFKLEDINKAFDLYKNHDGSLIKAIIEF